MPEVENWLCEPCVARRAVVDPIIRTKAGKVRLMRSVGIAVAVLKCVFRRQVVMCPGCQTPIVKDDGWYAMRVMRVVRVVDVRISNHISCTCGEHFCWACGKGGYDESSIYEHIWECEEDQ